jgi:hypothetical protein
LRIKTITVQFEANGKEDQESCEEFLRRLGGFSGDPAPTQRVKEEVEAGPYKPNSPRCKAALDALGRCQRVSLKSPAILETWAIAYPHVDLAAELLKAEAWALSKNVIRKSWAKTMNSWLSRAQEKTRGDGTSASVYTSQTVDLAKLKAQTQGWEG